MNIKNLLLIIKLILYINLIKSFEFVSLQFEKSGCTGRVLIIHSSTQCSTAGYYNIDKDGKTVHQTYSNNIKQLSDCSSNPQSNYDFELGKCDGFFKSYYNQSSDVSIPEGYCGEVKLLTGGDCSNGLELISYYNGVCNDGDDGNKYRYVCDGNKAKRYKCKDCMKQLDDCVFDKVLDSIDKCPSIKTKSLASITGDKSLPTPEPTKDPSDNSTNTSGNGSANSGSNTTGDKNGNTGSATGGDNGNHSTILNINILFILLLSVLILLN